MNDQAHPEAHFARVSPAGLRYALRDFDSAGRRHGYLSWRAAVAAFTLYLAVEHLIDPLWNEPGTLLPAPDPYATGNDRFCR